MCREDRKPDTFSHRRINLHISIPSFNQHPFFFFKQRVVAHINRRGQNSQKSKCMRIKCLQTKHIKGFFKLSLVQGPY